MLPRDVVGYHCLWGLCCLQLRDEDGDSMALQNIDFLPYDYMVS